MMTPERYAKVARLDRRIGRFLIGYSAVLAVALAVLLRCLLVLLGHGEGVPMISILIAFVILAIVLYVVSLLLDMVIPQTGLPPQVKPVVLAILFLVGLVGILGRGRFFW